MWMCCSSSAEVVVGLVLELVPERCWSGAEAVLEGRCRLKWCCTCAEVVLQRCCSSVDVLVKVEAVLQRC